MNETKLKTINMHRLMQILPHRYPFLLIDKIIDINRDISATGIKNVTYNEPFFPGHFPKSPIMPGVLVIEGMAQTSGAICAEEHYSEEDPNSVLFTTIDKAKFRKTAQPGDVIHYKVTQIKRKKDIFKFACVAEVNGQKIAEAEVGALMLVKND